LHAVPPTPQALASVAAASASIGGAGMYGHAPIQAAALAKESTEAGSSSAATFASHPQLGSRTNGSSSSGDEEGSPALLALVQTARDIARGM
jgi:hypothetical protein